MFPIPFMTMLAQQQEAEDHFASPRSDPSDSLRGEYALPGLLIKGFPKLLQRFHWVLPRESRVEARFEPPKGTTNCCDCG